MRGIVFTGIGALVAGCGDCGTSSYWIGAPGQEYVVLAQECGPIGGSFGRHFTNEPFSEIFFEGSAGSVGDDVAIILDLTPVTNIRFKTEHLVVGNVMSMENLVGTGIHDSTASGQVPIERPLMYGTIEVLDGPRTRPDRESFKLRWNLTIGDVVEPHPGGFQQHTGEAWIAFSPGLILWDDRNTLVYRRPPDAAP